jgi:predicted ABC-type ATPase
MEDEIYQRLTAGVAKPKKNKLAIFICGASGTGKTSMRHKFLRDLKIKTTFVYLNLDDIKEVGLEEARKLLQAITSRVIEDGYSIFLDGTCRNKQETVDRIKTLKSKGYKVMVGMVYASLPVVLKRLDERRGQYVSESVAKDIYQHMKKNAETYINIKQIDELYLYTNETSPNLIVSFDNNKKQVTCVAGAEEGLEEFYFDVSKYCN